MSDIECKTCGMWSHLECCAHVPKLRATIATLTAERDAARVDARRATDEIGLHAELALALAEVARLTAWNDRAAALCEALEGVEDAFVDYAKAPLCGADLEHVRKARRAAQKAREALFTKPTSSIADEVARLRAVADAARALREEQHPSRSRRVAMVAARDRLDEALAALDAARGRT